MNYMTKLGAVSAAALMIGAFGASAATLNITSITGAWSNAAPAGVAINNTGDTVTARWGVPTTWNGQKSGYDFTATDTPVVETEDTSFVLGEFVHHNFPITAPWLTSIALTVTLAVEGYGDIVSKFIFNHTETPNSRPCQSGSVSVCDDIVSIAQDLGSSTTFDIDGVEYVFNISGFSTSGDDNILTSFMTQENKENKAQLMGSFVTKASVSPVPLPAAGWLTIAGLGGLAALRRKKKQAA